MGNSLWELTYAHHQALPARWQPNDTVQDRTDGLGANVIWRMLYPDQGSLPSKL
jgi:hypothetical protein